MNNELQKDIISAGLSENEAAIYLAALELGETTVSRLAKKAGIKRTTTYLIIESLKEKGLLSSLKKEAASVFFAEDPRKLHEIMEERQQKIDKIMPQLLAYTNLIDKKPEIRYFEGVEGIKEVYRDSLKYPGHEMLTWYAETYAAQFDEKFILEEYIPKRLQKKVFVRAILPDSEFIREWIKNDQEHFRKSKLISKEKYNISIELNMYGINKVGIISFEEQIGIVIESKKIFESLKNIFEIMWDNLPD
jgi:sugar-specific transcriptional regulator TrmB